MCENVGQVHVFFVGLQHGVPNDSLKCKVAGKVESEHIDGHAQTFTNVEVPRLREILEKYDSQMLQYPTR